MSLQILPASPRPANAVVGGAPYSPTRSQHGASLIMVMLILIVVSILGVGAAQIAILGERSARNDRDYQVAWQSAEAALLDAEFDIRGDTGITATRKDVFTANNQIAFVEGCGTSGNSKGLCLPTVVGKPVWLQIDFAAASTPTAEFGQFTGRSFDAGGLGVKPVRKPRYMVEAISDAEIFGDKSAKAKKKLVYRVTAMGFGPREDIQAVIQTVFRKE